MLMRDFSSVVLILARSMLDRGENIAMGGRIAFEFVGDQLPWRSSLFLQDLAEELLGGSSITFFCYKNVENIAILIDGAPQIHLLSLDFDENFVDIPDVPQSTLLPSESSRVLRSELQTPEADGFVRDHDPTLSQQIFDMPVTECETVVEPDAVAYDLGRETMAFIAGCHAPIVVNHADHSST